MTLPVAALFGLCTWLLIGLWKYQLWPQLACFVASVYLLLELSNQNALLRIRSRMVSSTFILLACTANFLLPHLTGGIVQLCFIASFLLLFQTYQNPQATGQTYYSFVAVGLASIAYIHVLWYVPLLWILVRTQLQALSWRTWFSSLLGLATPYWFFLLWLTMPFGRPEGWIPDLSPLGSHFSQFTPQLSSLHIHLSLLTTPSLLVLLFTLVLAVTGIVHFWQFSFEDKIRIRLLYGFFTTMTLFTVAFILIQPQHFNVFMPLCFVCASPLIAHVVTFTSSRLSNILFFAALTLAAALTIFNFF